MKKLLLAVLLGSIALVQGQDQAALDPFPEYVGMPEPNIKLPPHVKAEPGKLTLFADFDHPNENWMPLYLVNRTSETQLVQDQDGDAYIKLEMQTPSGEWERVQAHRYSSCGNSYGDCVLPPGMHYRIRGYRPITGIAAKVRYSGYSKLSASSNGGDGFYTAEDLAAAQADGMATIGLPESIREQFNLERPLRDYKPSERVAVLRMAALIGEIPAVRSAAEKWVAELQANANPTEEQRQALSLAQEILKSNWGERTDFRRLLEGCFGAVKSEKRFTASFGTLEKESAITWRVIYDIARLQAGPTEEIYIRGAREPIYPLWKKILPYTAAHVLTAPQEESNWMVCLLTIKPLVDEFLTDDVFAPLMAGAPYYLVSSSAETLLRRNQWDRIAEQVVKVNPSNQYIVLSVVAQGVVRYKTMGMDPASTYREIRNGSEEQLFWAKVGKTLPLHSASVLLQTMGNDEKNLRNNFEREEFGELFDYWRKEMERSDQKSSDFEASDSASVQVGSIRFIATWRSKDDLPLLTSLLRYRGYSVRFADSMTGKGRPEKLVFGVRLAASVALKQMGVNVPDDIVFEADVKPDDASQRK